MNATPLLSTHSASLLDLEGCIEDLKASGPGRNWSAAYALHKLRETLDDFQRDLETENVISRAELEAYGMPSCTE